MKKIIILYSTGGLGHKKAAMALLDELKQRPEDMDVEMVDVLEYGNSVYKFLYLDFYVFLMKRARWLWAALFYFSNMLWVDVLTRKLRATLDYSSLPGLGEMLKEKSPDAIVATHYLLPSIAGILKKKEMLTAKLYAVITDYGPHSYWLSDDIDRFFVGADPVTTALVERGIAVPKIAVTGIPTTKEFSEKFDMDELRKKYGLDPDRKTIFMMSGGFGVGPMEEMLRSLNACEVGLQVITVCGHNEAAYADIGVLSSELDYPVILFGFTDKVAELMSVSDLMITKAGGISVTEAMNSRLPMILFASVPGQETWNEDMLTEAGAAEKAKSVNDIPVMVDEILASDGNYSSFLKGLDAVRRPDAARSVVDAVLEDIK